MGNPDLGQEGRRVGLSGLPWKAPHRSLAAAFSWCHYQMYQVESVQWIKVIYLLAPDSRQKPHGEVF